MLFWLVSMCFGLKLNALNLYSNADVEAAPRRAWINFEQCKNIDRERVLNQSQLMITLVDALRVNIWHVLSARDDDNGLLTTLSSLTRQRWSLLHKQLGNKSKDMVVVPFDMLESELVDVT
jgi:hypothetical protein